MLPLFVAGLLTDLSPRSYLPTGCMPAVAVWTLSGVRQESQQRVLLPNCAAFPFETCVLP